MAPNTRLTQIMNRLGDEYPDRRTLLKYEDAFQLLVSVALSAQTTDAAVNRATPLLFHLWPTPSALADADPAKVEEVIHSLGFFRQKTKNLIAASRLLVEQFNSAVPQSMDDLTSLPGIGRKSANVIRAHIWNLPGIIVDTHLGRVCRRLGLTEQKDPVKIEFELAGIIPEERQQEFSMTVNFHGRKYCMSRKPNCVECPLEDICPRTSLF